MSQCAAADNLPFISVIIPVYNRESFIRLALDSVFSQSYPAERMEVIVVDDGSTDDTSDILKRCGRDIRYIRQENKGIASARNKGIRAARGEVITFLDADDIWHEERLEKVAGAFCRNPDIGIVYHPVSLINASGETVHENFYTAFGYREGLSGWVAKEIFSGRIFCGGSSFAFRRSIIDRVCPVPEDVRRGVDYYITAIASCCSPAKYIPDVLGKYRIHGDNTTMLAGRDDIKNIATLNKDFAHMRERLIDRIRKISDLEGRDNDISILSRRQAQEKSFYHSLTGERIKGIKQIPAIFKGHPTLKELLRGAAVSFIALLIPSIFYPRMIKVYALLIRLKIIHF